MLYLLDFLYFWLFYLALISPSPNRNWASVLRVAEHYASMPLWAYKDILYDNEYHPGDELGGYFHRYLDI
jgi:hypothetical protein